MKYRVQLGTVTPKGGTPTKVSRLLTEILDNAKVNREDAAPNFGHEDMRRRFKVADALEVADEAGAEFVDLRTADYKELERAVRNFRFNRVDRAFIELVDRVIEAKRIAAKGDEIEAEEEYGEELDAAGGGNLPPMPKPLNEASGGNRRERRAAAANARAK